MSFAQLEEAARNSMENIEEEKKAGSAAAKSGKRLHNKQGIPPRDDEMQVYLSEIRQK